MSIGMSSSLSVCNAQWEQSSWLFSVYLPASSCSVPVLRKPVLQPRRPGRHNTTACERVGHWNKENERERHRGRERKRGREGHAEQDKKGDRDVGYQSERGVKRFQQLFSLKNQKRQRDFIADRARERKLRGQEWKERVTKWTKEERATEKRGGEGWGGADRRERFRQGGWNQGICRCSLNNQWP